MPGKRYSQHLYFSVVVHNVKDDILKSLISDKLQEIEPDWSLVAQEDYNESYKPGSHIHIFLKYQKKKSWKLVLDFFQGLAKGHTFEGKFLIPEGKNKGQEATLGHTKVKVGKGDFNECKKYLVDPDKKKKLDNNITENVRKLTLCERYPNDCLNCTSCGKKYFAPKIDTPFGYVRIEDIGCPQLCYKCECKKNALNLSELFPQDNT